MPRTPSLCTWLAPSRLPRPMTSIFSTPDSWRRVEIGVRLDPVDQDDAVGLVGVLVEIDRQPDRVGAEHDGVHVGLDRHAHGLGRHAVTGQELALAGGGRARRGFPSRRR